MVDSDYGQFLALRKILEEGELVPNIAQRLQVDKDLCRTVVQEEFQKHFTGETRNDLPEERILQLKFLEDKVSNTKTGEVLKGKEDKCLKLVLLDSNGDIVVRGRESSAKVEILLLDDSGNDDDDDDENNMTREKFERSIIQTGEKKKPHFSKGVYITLEKGFGNLSDLKLGHGPRIKPCNCRLAARIAQNLRRIIVHEAWTAPFQVIDKRDKQYDKHKPPSLKSEVWRLDGIGKDGDPCKRLKEKNIKTLRDFLFWLYVKPEELKQKTGAGDCAWNTIVDHAQTCTIDDERMFSHKSSTEPQVCIVYDAVGKLRGEIIESHFVPIDNLSAEKKDHMRKLLGSVLEDPSAFGERYDTSFNNEESLLKEFPYRSSDINASINIGGYQKTERGISSKRYMLRLARYPPSLKSEVWRLNGIGRKGVPCKRLKEKNIKTKRDFLFWLNVKLKELKQDHKSLRSLFENWSAFGERYGTFFNNEESLLKEFPYRSSDSNASTKILLQHGQNIGGYQKTERGSSSQSIINPNNLIFDSLPSMAEQCKPASSPFPGPQSTGGGPLTDLDDETPSLCDNLEDFGLLSKNHFSPTVHYYMHHAAADQQLSASACGNWGNLNPNNDMQHSTGLGSGASEMVGEPSSASFNSTSSAMEDWFDYDWYFDCPGPPSPNPMMYYPAYFSSYNASPHRNETCGNERSDAASSVVPQVVVDRPKGWKKLSRLLLSVIGWMSILDGCRSLKKRRLV